jgi:hypothetical protein
MKRKEENRSVIEPSCTFFKPNKIIFLPSNRVLHRKPDQFTGHMVLIDLTSLLNTDCLSSLEWLLGYVTHHSVIVVQSFC